MVNQDALERTLAELVAASEELLHRLRRRDASYLEALERREWLLERALPLCAAPAAPPTATAALERVRQLGEACEREAQALRAEALEGMEALDRHARFAESLGRLAKPEGPSLLHVKA